MLTVKSKSNRSPSISTCKASLAKPKADLNSSPSSLVIGTNDSSIVSKRSAERLGYFSRPQHLRHFVHKPQRRAPLINLGYAIRTLCVDLVIKRFLDSVQLAPESPTLSSLGSVGSKGVIVNLGCGYDPGFFKLAIGSSWFGALENIRYIDVDYPELISKKHHMISQSQDLVSVLPAFAETKPGSWVSLANGQASYALLGADLCDASAFTKALIDLLGGQQQDTILFVSEVSTVYMPPQKSDELLEALSQSFPRAVWTCLEQVLHSTPTAFSDTMLKHFQKLRTPLRGTLRYPKMSDQVTRLQQRWEVVEMSTLHEIWRGFDGFSPTRNEKSRMMSVEEFDEWEELDLFLSHYVVGIAYSHMESMRDSSKASETLSLPPITKWPRQTMHNVADELKDPGLPWRCLPMEVCLQRRGHTSTALPDGRHLIFGGFGLPIPVKQSIEKQARPTAHSRLSDPVLLSFSHERTTQTVALPLDSSTPRARLYHTASFIKTGEQDGSILLFGGRLSPRTPLEDAHLFDCRQLVWSPVKLSEPGASWPPARFRHAALSIRVGDSFHLLIHGGIGSEGALLSDSWWFDSSQHRWTRAKFMNSVGPRHSHQMYYDSLNSELYVFGGLLTSRPSPANPRIANNMKIRITFGDGMNAKDADSCSEVVNFQGHDSLLQRYAHCITPWDSDGFKVILSGGVSVTGVVPTAYQFVLLDLKTRLCQALQLPLLDPRTMIGHTASMLNFMPTGTSHCSLKGVMILGGGATCFSFGSKFDSEGVIISDLDSNLTDTTISNVDPSDRARLIQNLGTFDSSCQDTWNQVVEIPKVESLTTSNWKAAISESQPVVFTDLEIGDCRSLWTTDYLREACGSKKCSVHVSSGSPTLVWHKKNFRYVTMPLSELVDRTLGRSRPNETVYLRSLSTSPKQVSNFHQDFPELAKDFRVPEVMRDFVERHFFSSVLRISSADMGLWAHYDTCDNILVQVKGKKLVRMWHPREVANLYVEGSSSHIPDFETPDLDRFPLYRKSNPRVTLLEPGDTLYIPATWLHSVQSLEPSISINVFFRTQPPQMYAAHDTWGNVDLVPFQLVEKEVLKAVEKLNEVPLAQRQLYLKKLGMNLIRMADQQDK